MLCDGNLRCFVARQFFTQVNTLMRGKIRGLKCVSIKKKHDKYQVCWRFPKRGYCIYLIVVSLFKRGLSVNNPTL